MKQKWLARALSLVMVAAFVPSIAMAQDYDLKDGNIEVRADASGQYVSQGERQNELQTSETRITGTSDTSTITIDAGAGATANVTLENVNIDVSNTGGTTIEDHNQGKAAITATGDGNVNLNIEGNNTVSSGNNQGGVEKANQGNLTIGSKSGNGELEANGGKYAAGIGTKSSQDADSITITGGKITATGGESGAGIGGGYGGNGSNITISGGEVTAKGGLEGAGIGGAGGGKGTNITISGGNVEADGGARGAGIGGGGYNSSGETSDGTNITISGNANVKANGGRRGAGIGGGTFGNGSAISISDTAKVAAKGGEAASAIGGGGWGNGSDISVSDSANVKVSGGVEDKDPSAPVGAGAGIGNGGNRDSQKNPINGAEVDPDVSNLGSDGKILYYKPGANFDTDKPYKTYPPQKGSGNPGTSGSEEDPGKPGETDPKTDPSTLADDLTQSGSAAAALYQVTDLEGKPISYKAQRKDGVLTLTVTADEAILTGTLGGLETLAAEGVKEITLTNGTDSASITLADLIAKGASTDTYALTLQKTPTLTLNGENVDL